MPEWVKFLKERPILITLGLVGIFLVVVGVFSVVVMGNKQQEEGVVIKKSSEVVETQEITVDVSGAVEKPGVYKLAGNSRVNEALAAAGGLGANADRDWVSQNLNLAQKVTDGQKIFIPSQGETDNSNKDSPRSSNLQGLSLKVNINTASSAELDTLYGVGPVTAQKIIDNRPYSSTDDLLSKKVVKSSVYESIKDKISVY